MRKIFSLILTLALVLTFGAASAFAADSAGDASATVMKIAGTSGTVKIATEKGKDVTPSDGTKLLTGYTVKTAAASYCYISLDDAKAIKLDQNTKVKIEKSGKKIEITLKSGQLYFDVEKKLSGNESMNIKTSNLTTGIRGTSGTMQLLMPRAITEELRNKVLSDLSALRPRPVTTMQLFSGQTEIKPGIGIGPSAKLSAGEQLTFALTPGIPSTPGTPGLLTPSLPTSEQLIQKSELEIDNFGARAIIENAAIKNGMPVGEALQAPTEKIVEQAGAALETLQVADNALQQISDAASNPQLLDEKIAGEEQQAVQQTEAAAQTIEGAKTDAGSGSAEGAASEQVFENVSVQQSAGIDAGKAVFDGNAVTVEDTPATRPSTGGGSSSGGQQEEAWLTGYTGTYDCQSHAIATNLSARLADYDIWFFNDADRYNELVALYSRVESEYAEVRESLAGTSDGVPAFGAYLRNNWSGDLAQFDSNLATSDSQTVENVADSGVYYYFAIEKGDAAGSRYGDVRVTINPQELTVKWFLSDIRSGVEFGRTANITASSIGDISNNRPVPVAGIMGENGRFEQITCRATIGSDPTDIELAAIYTSDNPTVFDTTYNATVTGIDVVLYHHSDRPVETDALQASNYRLPESGLTISFSYYMPPQPVGSVVTDQDFFSAANRSTWGDYTTYDLAFIAESDGNESTYTKYARVNGPGTQSEVTTEVDVSEVLAALGSDSNLYNTILWDTGRTAQYLSPSVLSEAPAMAASASNRAIYISGAGIDCRFETNGMMSMVSGGALLVVKIGDGAQNTDMRFIVPQLNIASNVFVENDAKVTLRKGMRLSGDFINYNELILAQGAGAISGGIVIDEGYLTLDRGGIITIEDSYEIAFAGTGTPRPSVFNFSSQRGGNVNLYDGEVRRAATIADNYELPEDTSAKLMEAMFGTLNVGQVDRNTSYVYTASDGEVISAHKYSWGVNGMGIVNPSNPGWIAGALEDSHGNRYLTTYSAVVSGSNRTRSFFWTTNRNLKFEPEYDGASNGYVSLSFPIAGTADSFTEYVAPTGLNVTDGVFADSNRANWSDYTKYDEAFIARGTDNPNGLMEYENYFLGVFHSVVDIEKVKQELASSTYSSIYWEPTPADATELYIPSVEDAQLAAELGLDGNFEIAATTTNKAVFISGPGIATAGYTTFSAVGSNKLFVKVGDGSVAVAGDSQPEIQSANISVGSGVELINSGTLDICDLSLAANSKLTNIGNLNCSSGGFAVYGNALFTNESTGIITIDSYGPYVAMTGTGTLTNNGAMNLNAAFHINSGTTLLNRGRIAIPAANAGAASSAMIRVAGGTFTQEIPTGVNPENVFFRDERTEEYDATGAIQGGGRNMLALDSSGVVNLNGGRVEKSMNNAVSEENAQLRLATITKAIFGRTINIYNYSYTPAGGSSSLLALKASQGDSCAINGTLLSGSDTATTSDYFYVTGSNSGGPVGTVGINYISFPAPAGTYEVATNPTGLTIVSGAAANSWLAGYTGAYDTQNHLAISPTAIQQEDYYIWLFGPEETESFNTVKSSASALLGECTPAQATDTMAASLSAIREQLNEISIDHATGFVNQHEYSSEAWQALDALFAKNVVDSGSWQYVAIPKTAQNNAYAGNFEVDITKASIATKWYYEYEPDVEFTDGTTISISEVPDLHLGTPKIGIIVDGEFVEITQDYIIDEDSAQLSESRINISLGYPERDSYTEAGTYYATTSGITYTYNGQTVSGKRETANLYLTDGAMSISFVVVGTTDPTGTHINIVSGAAANSWLAGYSGTYDGDPHSPVSLSAVQQSDYWVWVFNDDDFDDNPNGVDYTPFLASMKAIFESGDFVATEESLEQVKSSVGDSQLPAVINRELSYNDYYLCGRSTLVEDIGVVDVMQSGDYYYFALPKYPTGSAFTGTFTIDITRAAVGVKWFTVHPDVPNALDIENLPEPEIVPAESLAASGAAYPYTTDVPVVPYIVSGPAVSGSYYMPTVGWYYLNGEDFGYYKLITTHSAVSGAGTYCVTVTGIECYLSADAENPIATPQMYVDNYYIDPATATYTYTLQPEGGSNTGLVVTDGVFDESNRANWSDSSNYDVRYVAVNDSSYMKYVNGAEMGTSVGIDEVLAAMSSTTYSSIYWDTGGSRRTVPDTYANDVEISAETANKAVFITGAGINFGTVRVTLSAEDGKKVYVRTESDSQDYSFGATTVTVDENAEFINSGSIKTQTLNVQHEGAMLTNIGAIEAKYVNVTNAGCLSNDAMFTLSEYGTGSVGAFNIQSGGATVTNSGILNIGGTPVTITDGAILANMSDSNIISEGATVTIGAGSLLSNEGNINIEGGTNVGIAVAAGGTLKQYEFGIIWDKREVSCSFGDYGEFEGVVSENRGLLSIEEDAEVMLYGGELRRSIAEGTNFNEIEYDEDVYKIEAIVKTLLSRKDGNDIIDPVDIVEGNFSYTPTDGAAPELPRAVLCKLNDGNGIINGSVMVGDELVLNKDLDSDVYTGDANLENTFWATYNSTGFENGDEYYVYLSFPVPAGTFADQV